MRGRRAEIKVAAHGRIATESIAVERILVAILAAVVAAAAAVATTAAAAAAATAASVHGLETIVVYQTLTGLGK